MCRRCAPRRSATACSTSGSIPSASRLRQSSRRRFRGGFIAAADAVITQFVTSGETFETRGRNGTDRHEVGSQHAAPKVPLVVLVDANSASASEMVAGCLQVHGRDQLVVTQ